LARIARNAGINVFDSISAGSSINSKASDNEFKVCNIDEDYLELSLGIAILISKSCP
jgi:hypothetical protein